MGHINTLKVLFLLLLTAVISSCSDSTSIPPERPVGNVSGKIVDGPISGAKVNIYSFVNGLRGTLLAGASTDNDGNFIMEIQAPTQLVLIEATEGSYTEQATGTAVDVPEGNVLQAIASYHNCSNGHTVNTPGCWINGLQGKKWEQCSPGLLRCKIRN